MIDQDLDDPPDTEFHSAVYDKANRTDGGLHIMVLDAFSTDLTKPYAIEQVRVTGEVQGALQQHRHGLMGLLGRSWR